ncbi:hypothetical protein L2E82_43192 [Cichorium intybus]|uniref:Uncharacterized protein n=1 Tax=Cichorium intybus TaxID=13427 RepID=A0ACB8ZSN5_CICIN|nr:hypothetical protein L2E82_43192 [Cichorium intybus]
MADDSSCSSRDVTTPKDEMVETTTIKFDENDEFHDCIWELEAMSAIGGSMKLTIEYELEIEYQLEMAETKQLVLVVEDTEALRPHWPTIVSTYLEKVIRFYCGTDNQDLQKELALVLFNAHGTRNSVFFFFLSNTSLLQISSNLVSVLDAAYLIVRSSWTKDVEIFMQWLNGIKFSGATLYGAAIAEGLSEALMMFPYVKGFPNPGNWDLQKHCILVAASNPYSVPTPVYTPPCFRPPQYDVMQPGPRLCDAEAVAKSFPTVSLSVISPWRFPKLEAIYNAANRLSPKTGRNIGIVTNPGNLVLISDHFNEACLALSQPEITEVPPNKDPVVVDLTEDSSG